MTTGEKKFQEVGERLKADKAAREVQEAAKKEEAMTELATIKNNPTLTAMYASNAQVGAENLGGGDLPQLKIHATGKSTTNLLADGKEPQDGFFFYKPTGEQFKEVICHILTISRGFRAEGINGKENVFNQILSGLILDNGNYKQFVMYFTGLRLSYLWDFGKEARKYTRAKPFAIPMFALRVKLSTERIDNSFGRSWIAKFTILKNEDNSPQLITDTGEFQFVKDNVVLAEEMIENVIASKAKEQPATEEKPQDITPSEPKIAQEAVDVSPEDIPF